LRVSQSQVAESWDLEARSRLPTLERGRGSSWERRDLSNDVSHSRFGGREEVDSRLLVVGSQTASLTPGPSFAHNLGYRCPNGQFEAIFYIYASRPFQWHQEHLNARCFEPCCRALNIRESRGTPNPHFFQVLGFTPTLGQSRVATLRLAKRTFLTSFPSHLLENSWIKFAFPYALLSHHEEVKWNTIGIKKKEQVSSCHIIRVLC
jgi:hypothetical protein